LWEVAIVEAASSGEFPDTLDGVQIGTVGRQVVEAKAVQALRSPGFVKGRVVIGGVVENENRLTLAVPADVPELAEKVEEGRAIESLLFAAKHKSSIAKTDGTIVANRPAGGVMQQGRLFDLRRHPHPTAGTVLLKVDLVERP